MDQAMSKVLDDIDKLITKKGFVYAMIMAQIEDQTIPINFLDKRNNQERLSSNEILFLWSLLVNKADFWQYPDTMEELYSMRREIGRLMNDLHLTFLLGVKQNLDEIQDLKSEEYIQYIKGGIFQEAIFYSGGALYDEEYIYYIKKRFAEDSQWLKENKGYDKDEFCDIASKIKQTLASKIKQFRFLSLPETWEELLAFKPSELSEEDYKKELVLSQFFYDQNETLSLTDFCDRLKNSILFKKEDLEEFEQANTYLQLFSIMPSSGCNESCKKPGDYSILMSSPIILTPDGHYLLIEMHQLFKSLYDVPRFWLNEQLLFHKKIGSHSGDFSERQTLNVLNNIFGERNCYKDIIVLKEKRQVTDIDALCIWKDYAICFQIKSKGLTLSSRQGDIESIRSDFQKSFQAAFDQGVKCREALLSKSGYYFVVKESGRKVSFPALREVYIVCETSDEYPSLTYQMSLLLKRKETEPDALAINLFDIDIMSKYLNTPYYFVHYIRNRLRNFGKTRTDVESNCLYAYTHNRLFLTGEKYNIFMFDNSFAKAIDAELLPKFEKHEDITVDNGTWRDATFDALLNEIDSSSNSGLSEAILKMLNYSRSEVKQIGLCINEQIHKQMNGIQDYFSISKGDFGFTFICIEMDAKRIVHNLIKRITVSEIKTNEAKSWLTIAHYKGSETLVGAMAFVAV